ncbi:MAG TPA: hypothetical protein VNA32_05670 [Actinomycetota bacterium]|nr:hypothetical protein [Actinomycetota bacterium]
MQIYKRDGAYRDAQGRLHKVCRNWLEASRLGLPAPCPHGGEDEVWACHGQGWSTHPALRLVPENVLALCRHCDPDRNADVRPGWWGNPRKPVLAGWERRQRPRWARGADHKLLGTVALMAATLLWAAHYTLIGWGVLGLSVLLWTELALSILLWAGALLADARLRHFASLRPYLLGPPGAGFGSLLTFVAVLLGLWAVCLVLAHVVLRHRLIGRSASFGWSLVRRLARKIHHAKEPQPAG